MTNSVILFKRSTVVGKTPLSTDLQEGELALNVADGLAFMKKTDGTVVPVGKPLSQANIVAGLGYTPANVAGDSFTGTLTTHNILPAADLTYDIGSPTARWNNMYVNTAHLGVNTLYLGDTPVLGTSMNTIIVKADVDQSLFKHQVLVQHQ
jgi:hypothetical protein